MYHRGTALTSSPLDWMSAEMTKFPDGSFDMTKRCQEETLDAKRAQAHSMRHRSLPSSGGLRSWRHCPTRDPRPRRPGRRTRTQRRRRAASEGLVNGMSGGGRQACRCSKTLRGEELGFMCVLHRHNARVSLTRSQTHTVVTGHTPVVSSARIVLAVAVGTMQLIWKEVSLRTVDLPVPIRRHRRVRW
jgi:hypothetical protein